MAKEVLTKIKLQVPGGQATPAPQVGPALGQHGVKPGQFISQFNDRTKDAQGMIIPVVITVYKDKSFSFITKSPPAAVLLKKAAGLVKASGLAGRESIGKVTRAQVEEIAKVKQQDLSAASLDGAMKIIMGTARSMGLEVEE